MGVGSLIGLGLQGAQAATSGKGGSTQAPQGGVSPAQAALSQYTYGQDLEAAAYGYGMTNTGASTMKTQATGGARNKLAAGLAGQSDVNQQNQIQAAQQLQQLAQQNQQQAGFAAGSQGGSGGGSGFGSSTNTSGGSSSDTGSSSTA
jgi:hypothetical protein